MLLIAGLLMKLVLVSNEWDVPVKYPHHSVVTFSVVLPCSFPLHSRALVWRKTENTPVHWSRGLGLFSFIFQVSLFVNVSSSIYASMVGWLTWLVFLILILILFYEYMCILICLVCVYHVLFPVKDPLELELQKVVIIRKAETWSFARAARAANHWTIFPVPDESLHLS